MLSSACAGRNGGWSPALTINKLCLSLMSMLASNTELVRPFPSGSFNVDIPTSMTSWQGCCMNILGLTKVRVLCPCSRFTESQQVLDISGCHSFGVRHQGRNMANCPAEAAARRHGILPQVAWAFPERDALGIRGRQGVKGWQRTIMTLYPQPGANHVAEHAGCWSMMQGSSCA